MSRKLLYLLLPVLTLATVRAADVPVSAPAAPRDPEYRIQPTDRLALAFRYSPEYNQTIVVQPDGFASLDLVGTVKLAGLTMDAARSTILAKLSTRLNDPEITLKLQEYVKPSFVVAGQVVRPGNYELHGPVTAFEAIAMAGGFKDSSKTSKVILYRRIDGDIAEAKILDLKKISDPSHPPLHESVDVHTGDLLVVPQNNVSKVERFIHWANIGVFANTVP